jgi:RNA polymerase sigma factor (sigma-70 family)
MTSMDLLAHQFEKERSRLIRVARGILHSWSDTEDVVQESWLRLAAHDGDAISNVSAWLTTTVTRLALDRLRRRRVRGYGEMPQQSAEIETTDVEAELDVAQSVGLALVMVLETLPPAERVAFILHDIFAVPFSDIAATLQRSNDATRQLASRARRRLAVRQSRALPRAARQLDLAEQFLTASRKGDMEAIVELLDPGVILRVDINGTEQILHGAREVGSRAAQFRGGGGGVELILFDGILAFGRFTLDELKGAMLLRFGADRLSELELITSASRLQSASIARAGSGRAVIARSLDQLKQGVRGQRGRT